MIKAIICLFVAAAALLQADTLLLKDGTRLEGSFVGGNSHSVRFAVNDQVNSYQINDIESIHFASGPPPGASEPPPRNPQAGTYPPYAPAAPAAPVKAEAPAAPAYATAQGGDAFANAPAYNAQAPTAPPATPAIQIPAGTQIVVRMIDAANSERDKLGQSYRASVDEPVMVNGQTVIPRGADATATLVDLQQSGKIEGRTVLTLDLKTVTAGGKTYDITTTGVPEASKSRGARSAKTIGGGAVLGAIIGAAVGGGKGAAIGAGSGAAVGTAAEIATSGQKVKIPAETRLTFTLQNPLSF